MSVAQLDKRPSTLADYRLKRGHIHIWCTSVDQPASVVKRYQASLSSHEIERADKYHFEEHRNKYILTHGVLRHILAGYLQVMVGDIDPKSIVFSNGPFGKPGIADSDFFSSDSERGNSALKFSISHSRDIAVYAISLGLEVGIDIEYLRSIAEMDRIITTFFSEDEKQWLHSLKPEEKLPAFYDCWCRKEALIKAIGSGLSESLGRYTVVSPTGEKVDFVQADGAMWQLAKLELAKGYSAALAVENGFDRITYYEWS